MSNTLTLAPSSSSPDSAYFMPGSKSFTNRALVMAALAEGESTLCHASPSDDSRAMIAALKTLGVTIREDDDEIIVKGLTGHFEPYSGTIDVGPAGTTMRFLIALSTLVEGGNISLRGTERMHQRPVGTLVQALRDLGAEITYDGTAGCPPVTVRGRRALERNAVSMDGSQSSQFFTALLLIGPAMAGGLTITVKGNQISQSYIDMTLQGLHDFGVAVENHDYKRYFIPGDSRYQATHYQVEGDASGASYLWGIAALSGRRIQVENIRHDSVQGDARFPELLERMGCKVERGVSADIPWIAVTGTSDLQAIEADMTLMPDTAQTLAVVAAAADGTTRLTGLSTLKHKETDRLLAMQTELHKIGVKTEVTDDSISIHGSLPASGDMKHEAFDTYEDHRMAMSLGILGARYSGITVRDPEVVSKSFPDFWKVLARMGVEVR